jgi:hypothetical protein
MADRFAEGHQAATNTILNLFSTPVPTLCKKSAQIYCETTNAGGLIVAKHALMISACGSSRKVTIALL